MTGSPASGWTAGYRRGWIRPATRCFQNYARISQEVDGGWSLFVAGDHGQLAAMLALHLPKMYLDQLFVAPHYQGRSLGRQLLAFTRTHLPDEIWLRCVRENDKAWR